MATSELQQLVEVRTMVRSGEARQIRLDASLSLEELGRAAEVTRGTILRWERGERSPHGAAALRYRVALLELRRQLATTK